MEPSDIKRMLKKVQAEPASPKPGDIYRHYRGHAATILFLAVDKCGLGVEVVYLCSKCPEVPFTCPLSEWGQAVEGPAGVVPRYMREHIGPATGSTISATMC